MMRSILILIKTFFVFSFIAYFTNSDDAGQPLILTPLIESGKMDEAKQRSKVHIKNFCRMDSYAGFLTVDKQYNSNLFFWFFKSKNKNAPVFLWLQGGPGVSSMLGLFKLNGPFKVNKNLKLKCRKYSWTKLFSMLYIDNPIGTGFSFTESKDGYARTLANSTDNLFTGLEQFFTLFKELQSNDFYASGESYAGKFVPALAYKIHTKHPEFLNFKGIAVGNGFTDPISTLHYGPFLRKISLIDDHQQAAFDKKEKAIRSLIEAEKYEAAFNESDGLLDAENGTSLLERFTGYTNVYDIRYSSNKDNYTSIEIFLNQTESRKALHTGNVPFVFGLDDNGTSDVMQYMSDDFYRSVVHMLPAIFENYKVLLYSGNMDMIVAPVNGYRFLLSLQWKYRDEYLKATRKVWKVKSSDKEVAGYVKTVHKFNLVFVRNAGHSVPGDKPRAAFDMIKKFANNKL